MKTFTLTALTATFFAFPAFAATNYLVTVTNGSNMPLSPAAIYVSESGLNDQKPGATPSRGFVQLCQTGNPSTRIEELRATRMVTNVMQTSGLIQPGESRTLEVAVADPAKQSIHLETMYGKTKDTCGVAAVGSHALYALKSHVSADYVTKDDALQTGAFQDPVLPAEHEAYACAQAKDAVSCVRELALASTVAAKIRFNAGYLPSVVSFLETKFGAADTLSLLFPSSGAIKIAVKLKH